MRKPLSWRSVVTISILLLSMAAKSAVLFEHDDTFEEAPEMFPLTAMPKTSVEPLRSEAPSGEEKQVWLELRGRILKDFGSRLTSDFQVPEGLNDRTAFWFDIYARYGEAHHVIHHVLYPWVVFEVVDTTETLVNSKGPTWLRRDRANKFAQKRLLEVRQALQKLARRKTYGQLPPIENQLFKQLASVPGPRSQVLKVAAQNVRSQLGQKDFFQRGLINSSRYLPYMEDEFRKAGLPTELTRMPFVESSFNEEAYSKVGASGIWQIMPRTGKAYMIVDKQIDERNSPLKATRAAAKLLRSYHRALKSWPLTITSYNHGIGNIQKAIKHGRSRDLAIIISRYHDGDFRFASSNFFTCFLAALYAEKYHELIFKNVPREPLQEREEIKLAGRTHARHLSKITGLGQNEILKYNLDLRSVMKLNGSVPRGFSLHLPPGYKDRFTRQIGTQDNPKKTRT